MIKILYYNYNTTSTRARVYRNCTIWHTIHSKALMALVTGQVESMNIFRRIKSLDHTSFGWVSSQTKAWMSSTANQQQNIYVSRKNELSSKTYPMKQLKYWHRYISTWFRLPSPSDMPLSLRVASLSVSVSLCLCLRLCLTPSSSFPLSAYTCELHALKMCGSKSTHTVACRGSWMSMANEVLTMLANKNFLFF